MNCFLVRSLVYAVFLILLFGKAMLLAVASANDELDWSYSVPKDVESIGSGRSVWLQEKALEDLDLEDLKTVAHVDLTKTKFAEFQYGGTESRTIAIAIEKRDEGTRLFIDVNRDRCLKADEEIKKQNGVFLANVDAEFGTGKSMTPLHLERSVRFRPSLFGKTISISTAGCLDGNLEVKSGAESTRIKARVFDANSNGRFGDADDFYLADFDQNGKLDRFSERKIFGQVFDWESARYMLLTKSGSENVVAKRIKGQGRVRIGLDVDSKIVNADMLLTGNDGNIYSKSFQNGSEFELPAGKYTFTALSLSLQKDDASDVWHYNFSAFSTKTRDRQFTVTDNGTTQVAPLKNLVFRLLVSERKTKGPWESGELLTLRPTLYSEGGLAINNCWTGNKDVRRLQLGKAATMRFSTGSKLGDIVGSSGFR